MLVTGRNGQIVRSLEERARGGAFEIFPLGRPELDLTAPQESIVSAIEAAGADVVVSAAAYTAVDRAESESELAFAINEAGARAVARAAHRLRVPLIHLSTDYVFDGMKELPYVETDPPNPTGVYGSSKLAGEQAVLAEHDTCAVLRTAWVYSPFASNFVKTMLRLASDRDSIDVVSDQRGNPTNALDIADGILAVATNLLGGAGSSQGTIFHMTAGEDASWAEFAEAIFAASARANGPSASVRRIATADYPTPSTRPANSRLDCTKLERIHGVRLPTWRSSLPEVVNRLVAESIHSRVSQE